MNESSTTVPQFRHATWPEESSKSLGLELEHPGQTFADMAADSNGCGSIPLDYSVRDGGKKKISVCEMGATVGREVAKAVVVGLTNATRWTDRGKGVVNLAG